MIELTKFQQNKTIWINESNIESMEKQIVRDGNGDVKSTYVDVQMINGRMYRVDNTIEDINKSILSAKGYGVSI
jgi:uncharacterized protein YlzI (FlbEa/FlbD family)